MAYRWLSPYEAGCHLNARITSYPEIISYTPPIFKKKQLHAMAGTGSHLIFSFATNITANAVVAVALINQINRLEKPLHSLLS